MNLERAIRSAQGGRTLVNGGFTIKGSPSTVSLKGPKDINLVSSGEATIVARDFQLGTNYMIPEENWRD